MIQVNYCNHYNSWNRGWLEHHLSHSVRFRLHVRGWSAISESAGKEWPLSIAESEFGVPIKQGMTFENCVGPTERQPKNISKPLKTHPPISMDFYRVIQSKNHLNDCG
jgi:hypothetical protein